jgi:sugar lactone lactonase YvrE
MVGTVNDTIFQYSLSTAFDLSTASYDSVSFNASSQDTVPQGLTFNNDGTKMYMVGSTNDRVYQYTTGSSSPATITYPASVKWSGATTPDAPAAGEKDVYVFVTTDGGTTYYAKQAGDAVA